MLDFSDLYKVYNHFDKKDVSIESLHMCTEIYAEIRKLNQHFDLEMNSELIKNGLVGYLLGSKVFINGYHTDFQIIAKSSDKYKQVAVYCLECRNVREGDYCPNNICIVTQVLNI